MIPLDAKSIVEIGHNPAIVLRQPKYSTRFIRLHGAKASPMEAGTPSLDNGKPAATLGRKATGLSETAGLPKEKI